MAERLGSVGHAWQSRMSAIGPKQTWTSALQMSAFGSKADMTFYGANVCF